MTQNIGFIPAVGLLGYTRMCQTAPESRTAGPDWTYHHIKLGSWTCATPWSTSTRPARQPRPAMVQKSGTPRKELCGTDVLEAIMAGVLAVTAVALFLAGVAVGVLFVVAREIRREDRLYSLPEAAPSLMARGTRRLTGFGRRDLELRVLAAGRRAAA